MWKACGEQLEETRVLNRQSWVLNFQCIEMIMSQKAKSTLRPLLSERILGIVVGIVWILFLATLVYYNNFQNPFFAVSVSVILLFNTVAVINYIRHLVMISQVSYSESITVMQEKLATLKTSIISNNRFLLLQFPFYTTWTYSMNWIVNDPLSFWLIEIPVTILLAVLGIWLYTNCSVKNMHKPWVKALINSAGFRSVTQAQDFIHEIEEYKKDRG